MTATPLVPCSPPCRTSGALERVVRAHSRRKAYDPAGTSRYISITAVGVKPGRASSTQGQGCSCGFV
jgi:hypothetical protein